MSTQANPSQPAPFIAEVRRYMDHRGICIEEMTRLPDKSGSDLSQVLFGGGMLPIPRYHINMGVIVGPDAQHKVQIPIHAAFNAEGIEDAFAKSESEIQKAVGEEIKRRQEEALRPKLVTPM